MNAAPRGSLWQAVGEIPRRISSVKVGSFLIVAILLFTLVVAFFPYTEAAGLIRRAGQAFGLESISRASELEFQERFESPPFIALVFVLGLSLCLSLYFRVRNELLRRRAEHMSMPLKAIDGLRDPAVAVAREVLKRRGYRVRLSRGAGCWQVHAAKGDLGVLGSVIFHIGILLVLAAVVLSTSASFRASVKLTEGQSFDARTDAYGMRKVGRWYSPPEEPLTFRLVRVVPDYGVNGATTVASIVEPTLEGSGSRFLVQAPVHVSRGLTHAGVTIHQGRETGYAPLVVVEHASGKRLVAGHLQLATIAGAERESYMDEFRVPDSDAKVELELLPDAVYRNGAYATRSGALKRPVLHAVVREKGNAVFDEYVALTQDASAGGYTVFFGGVRRWSQIDVTDTPAVPVLIAATLLGSLGLGLRLSRVRRRVVVTLRELGDERPTAFELSGSSEKFQRQFEEELRGIRAALAERLSAVPWAARTAVPPASRARA